MLPILLWFLAFRGCIGAEVPPETQPLSARFSKTEDVLSSLVEADTKLLGAEGGADAAAWTPVQGVPKPVPLGKPVPKAVPLPKPVPMPIPKMLPMMKPVPIPKILPIVKPVPVLPHVPFVTAKKMKLVAPKIKKAFAMDLKISKKIKVKKAIKTNVAAVKKVKVLPLKAKPKVTKLKPIVHVIHKPVAVYHKVPVPKKVMIPKFVPVPKPVPVKKIVPVPIKVPVVKIIPKIIKVPKPIPVLKVVPVKKFIPVGVPVPVPKIHKVPVLKPVPYLKPIPIPIPKPVKKFIPVPVKKVIKVAKPYYVPVKVPHVTKSYVRTQMVVPVPPTKIASTGTKKVIPVKSVPSKAVPVKEVDKEALSKSHGGTFTHFGSGGTAFGTKHTVQSSPAEKIEEDDYDEEDLEALFAAMQSRS